MPVVVYCKLCNLELKPVATRLSYPQHYYCDECKVIWVLLDDELAPCELPDVHLGSAKMDPYFSPAFRTRKRKEEVPG